MNQSKANAKMCLVDLQKGTGYCPPHEYTHSDKENIVHLSLSTKEGRLLPQFY